MQYEAGKYAEALATCDKALELFPPDTNNTALLDKILTRRTKVLLLLHADDERYHDDSERAVSQAATQKAALERRSVARMDEDATAVRLTSQPRYRASMRPVEEQ